MLHPLEHVRDHQNPLTDAPALASRQAPQLGRPRFAAKEVCRHRPPQTWYAALLTLPHLEITGSRYNAYFLVQLESWEAALRAPASVRARTGKIDRPLKSR